MKWIIGIIVGAVIVFFLQKTILEPLWDKWQNKKKPIKELEEGNNLINKKLEIRTKPIKVERNHDEYRDNRNILNIMFLLNLYNRNEMQIDIKKLQLSFNSSEAKDIGAFMIWYKHEKHGKALETETAPLIIDSKKLMPIWFYCRINTDSKEKMQKIWSSNQTINIEMEDSLGEKYVFNSLEYT